MRKKKLTNKIRRYIGIGTLGLGLFLDGLYCSNTIADSCKKDINTTLILQRARYTEESILGNLYLDSNLNGKIDEGDELLCNTLELPYRNNHKNISSIPSGEYPVKIIKKNISSKFPYEHLGIEKVSGRIGILFHCGNTPEDTRGCILPGSAVPNRENYVSGSRKALSRILNTVNLNTINKKSGKLTLKVVDTQ